MSDQGEMKGTIKRVFKDKGFGFVTGADGVEYFFHRTAVKNAKFEDLAEGQEVGVDPGEGEKGPRAEAVWA